MAHNRSLPPPMVVIFIALAFLAVAAFAQQNHEPYTIHGVQVRTNITMNDSTGRPMDMGTNAFQELAPCRLISTLKADDFTAPFGGPAFKPGEARNYPVVNAFVANPCLTPIPNNALALAIRLQVYDPKEDGTIYLTPGAWTPFSGSPVLKFKAGQSLAEEALS